MQVWWSEPHTVKEWLHNKNFIKNQQSTWFEWTMDVSARINTLHIYGPIVCGSSQSLLIEGAAHMWSWKRMQLNTCGANQIMINRWSNIILLGVERDLRLVMVSGEWGPPPPPLAMAYGVRWESSIWTRSCWPSEPSRWRHFSPIKRMSEEGTFPSKSPGVYMVRSFWICDNEQAVYINAWMEWMGQVLIKYWQCLMCQHNRDSVKTCCFDTIRDSGVHSCWGIVNVTGADKLTRLQLTCEHCSHNCTGQHWAHLTHSAHCGC